MEGGGKKSCLFFINVKKVLQNESQISNPIKIEANVSAFYCQG